MVDATILSNVWLNFLQNQQNKIMNEQKKRIYYFQTRIKFPGVSALRRHFPLRCGCKIQEEIKIKSINFYLAVYTTYILLST